MSNYRSGLQPNSRMKKKNLKSEVTFIFFSLFLSKKIDISNFKMGFITSFKASFLLNDSERQQYKLHLIIHGIIN